MRLVTYSSSAGPRVAAVRGDGLVDLAHADPALPTSLKALLALGDAVWPRVRAAAEQGAAVPRAGQKLLAPISDPEKVICIGLNYADHAAESGAEIPSQPVVFCKFPTAVCGHEDAILLPASSRKVDYEAELVVVIGRAGRDLSVEQARGYVAGYACGHDVSARDWQLETPGKQWLLGKTFDTFAPWGPELVTPDEVGDEGDLRVTLRLNGAVMQNSSTKQLIFSVPRLVSHVSHVCTLKPGDILFTGTPPGVGMARKPPVFLQPGDVVEIEIEKLGVLRNPVAAR